MRLRDLADVDSDSEVSGFVIDHRKVARGSVFGAFKGAVFDGEDFIGPAIDRGAVAVVARAEARVERVPHLADAHPRRLFAKLAAKYYAPYPETVVAVTGTNGKTSTVEMTRQIWRMGDTGSLALGGALGAIAVASHHEIVLLIVGGLFVMETASVMIQVFWFKRTGRRIFRMAPIHHHFEKKGWTESQVVIRFWIIAVILAMVGLSTLKLR